MNCDGSGPHAPGDIRVYPLGAGGNLLLCAACWEKENNFRTHKAKEAYEAGSNLFRVDHNWPLIDWHTAERYET